MVVKGADGAHSASFSLANRLLRLVWGVVWIGLFRPSPRPFHAWRAFLLRVFGAKIGRNVHVYPGVRIWAPWMLEIGDDTGIGSGVNLYSMAPIRIGVRCVISQGAHLCCGSHDAGHGEDTNDAPEFRDRLLRFHRLPAFPDYGVCLAAPSMRPWVSTPEQIKGMI